MATILFQDDFNSGESILWENEIGEWVDSSGVYAATSPSTFPNAHSSLPFNLTDFSVDVDINNIDDGGLWLRSSPALGTAIGRTGVLLVSSSGNLYWHIVENASGYGSSLNIAHNLFVTGVSDPTISVSVVGDTYQAFVDGNSTPATTLTTSSFPSGEVALYDFSSQTFDNFVLRVEDHAPIVLEAEADTFIRTDLDVRRNDNYGKNKTLIVGTGRGGGGMPFGSADAQRSLLQFDLSSIPTETVENATLEITLFESPSSQYTVDIHRLLAPWDEGNGYEGPSSTTIGAPPDAIWVDPAEGVAWAGAGDNPASDAQNNQTQPDFDPVVVASAAIEQGTDVRGEVIQWDITSLVNDWLSGTVPNNGILLRDVTTDGTFRSVVFGSREGDFWDFPGTSPEPVTGPRLVIYLPTTPASLTVDTLVDENDGDLSPGDVSLREALAFIANGGTIDFAAGLAGTITLDSSLGQLVIDQSLTINGPGADIITVSGGDQVRVFLVDDGNSGNQAEVVIDGLTISNGLGQGSTSNDKDGGGIYNSENLTVTDSTIHGNKADDSLGRNSGGGIFNTDLGVLVVEGSIISNNMGGGIDSRGSLTIVDSSVIRNKTKFDGGGIGAGDLGVTQIFRTVISKNEADGFGGGINISGRSGIGSATVSLIDSTISLNKAGVVFAAGGGGGINADDNVVAGALKIFNSTISSNEAANFGGGIRTSSTIEVFNSTITNNTADSDSNGDGSGGGIAGNAKLGNTIIAGNFDTPNNTGSFLRPDVDGTFISEGYNLIGDGTGSTGFTAPGDQVGTTANSIDPLLAPLANYGGTTHTHAIRPGSPTIDSANPADFPDTDQRGVARPQGSASDIGAFELRPNDIIGTPGMDQLMGTDDNDLIVGFQGRDYITTGGGEDVIAYTSVIDAGDIILDFALNSDKIYLVEILDSFGYEGTDPIGDGYVQFHSMGSSTILELDADGLSGPGTAQAFALLQGVASVGPDQGRDLIVPEIPL